MSTAVELTVLRYEHTTQRSPPLFPQRNACQYDRHCQVCRSTSSPHKDNPPATFHKVIAIASFKMASIFCLLYPHSTFDTRHWRLQVLRGPKPKPGTKVGPVLLTARYIDPCYIVPVCSSGCSCVILHFSSDECGVIKRCWSTDSPEMSHSLYESSFRTNDYDIWIQLSVLLGSKGVECHFLILTVCENCRLCLVLNNYLQ